MPESNHKNHLVLYDYSKLLKNAVTALKYKGIGRIYVNKVEPSQYQENTLDVQIDYSRELDVLDAELFNAIGIYRVKITNHVNLIWRKRNEYKNNNSRGLYGKFSRAFSSSLASI